MEVKAQTQPQSPSMERQRSLLLEAFKTIDELQVMSSQARHKCEELRRLHAQMHASYRASGYRVTG